LQLLQQLKDLVQNNKYPDLLTPLQNLRQSISSNMQGRKEHRDNFIQLGGPEILIRIIYSVIADKSLQLFYVPEIDESRNRDYRSTFEPDPGFSFNLAARASINTTYARRLRSGSNGQLNFHVVKLSVLNETLGILRELCFYAPTLAQRIGKDKQLTIYLFQLMHKKIFFENAAGLAEEILSVKDDSFDLTSVRKCYFVLFATRLFFTFNFVFVAYFNQIIEGFSCRQLAFFCRVLALIVFEPEDRKLLENSSIFYLQHFHLML